MTAARNIPVIDIFAGPGGLGEGFSQYDRPDGGHPFNVVLSIEKDERAHETLRLRSFFRHSESDKALTAYYQCLREEITRAELFKRCPKEAALAVNEAWLAELGKAPRDVVRQRIKRELGDSEPWVLIGGPPCQAYSTVGRSRNKGNPKYEAADDKRQFLYVEYLQIIADHWPAVFVMENVKGLLSATVDRQRVFDRIHEDLESPEKALKREGRPISHSSRSHMYKVFSVIRHGLFGDTDVRDFVVKAEDYGIPQARHRLILLGVRDDLSKHTPESLKRGEHVSARTVLENLPRLRSGLSQEDDSPEAWQKALRQVISKPWLNTIRKGDLGDAIVASILQTVEDIRLPKQDRGKEFIACEMRKLEQLDYWYSDENIQGVCNHTSRCHMASDLLRYLFASCFAKVVGRSPELVDFPKALRPEHDNVNNALQGELFSDRFRVQMGNKPSTTITSHIAKDGHYYIHYDPSQCRSLTVREAARLQTFPDNYLFCGPRTSQYGQVGNAVPPLLAYQIAEVVWKVLKRNGTL